MFIVKDTTTGLYLNTEYRRKWRSGPWDERKYARVYKTRGAVLSAMYSLRGRLFATLWPELWEEFRELAPYKEPFTAERRTRWFELQRELVSKWTALSSADKHAALASAGYVLIPVTIQEEE